MNETIKEKLQHGWWGYGNGGHRFEKKEGGVLLVESVTSVAPDEFISPMALLVIEQSVVNSPDFDPQGSYKGVMLEDYGWALPLELHDVKYIAWFRKRLRVNEEGVLEASLNRDEMARAHEASVLRYGVKEFALMSEFIVFDEDGNFTGRADIPGVIVNLAMIHEWVMTISA
jgi:hypothetical protein